jgi:hypothetical protein
MKNVTPAITYVKKVRSVESVGQRTSESNDQRQYEKYNEILLIRKMYLR